MTCYYKLFYIVSIMLLIKLAASMVATPLNIIMTVIPVIVFLNVRGISYNTSVRDVAGL